MAVEVDKLFQALVVCIVVECVLGVAMVLGEMVEMAVVGLIHDGSERA